MTTPPRNPGLAEPGEPLPLPGIEAPRAGASPLEQAARRTLTALHGEQLLHERHALTAQLILELAQVVTVSVRTGKASAAAMAAAQILAALDTLLPEQTEGGDDAWTELAAELRAAAARNTAGPVAAD